VRVKPDHDMEALYRDQAERLWRALFAYTGNHEVASDAVAEAFAQCLHRRAAVRLPTHWLWRSAFNIARAEMKAQRRWVDRPEQADRSYALSEPLWDLLDALSGLPPKQRAALVLHYYCGYSTQESAEILGCTPTTVRVHLSQGRRRVRELLRGAQDE
jgi:RNA polymerase sigma-70 factor (ECF subfamily)